MRLGEEKKFLYIVGAFPPLIGAGGIRALEFSERLIRNNFRPIILTRKNYKNEILNLKFFDKIPPDLTIIRTNYFKLDNRYIREIFNKFLRIDFYIDWIPFAYLKARKILKKNRDLKFIYATGLPSSSFILAYLLKKRYNLPLVVEYRDPWSYNPFFLKTDFPLNQRIELIVEKKLLKLADIIITISSELSLFLMNKFPFIKTKPIYEIPNGLHLYNTNEYPQRKKGNELIFTFTGKLHGGRNVLPLLKIISDLKKEGFFNDFKFTLKLFGAYKHSLKNQIKELRINNIVYLGDFITRSQVFKELINSDLAVHIGENLNYPTLAFKIFDYLSVRKKILYLGREDSYTAKFIKENDIGIIIPINNYIKGKLMFKNLLEKLKNNNLETLIEKEKISKFSWEERFNDLIKVLSKYF